MALQEQLKQQGDFLFKHRSYFPLLFIAMALSAIAYHHQHSYTYSSTVLLISELMQSIAIYVGLFGFLIRVYTIGFTPKNTSGRNTKEGQIADELNTKGLYSLTRNPLYVGNFFMWMGTVLFTGVFWFSILFIFIFWLYYEKIILLKKFFLREKFGNNYLNWAEKTPIFIPNKLCYDHPIMAFDWKKIIIKKNRVVHAFFSFF